MSTISITSKPHITNIMYDMLSDIRSSKIYNNPDEQIEEQESTSQRPSNPLTIGLSVAGSVLVLIIALLTVWAVRKL